MMNNERLDIVLLILQKLRTSHPGSNFVKSLFDQYCMKGSLSKSQMEGLYDKASRSCIPASYLATLNAIIKRKRSFQRSKNVFHHEITDPDLVSRQQLNKILISYPQHKRALFLLEKLNSGRTFDNNERADIAKIHQALFKG